MIAKHMPEKENHAHHCPPQPTRAVDKVLVSLGIASLLVLMVYTWFTYQIASSTERAIKESGRAWLIFSGVLPPTKQETGIDGNPTALRFNLLNSGHGPARDTSTRCQFVTVALPGSVPVGALGIVLVTPNALKDGVPRFPLPLPPGIGIANNAPAVTGVVGLSIPLTVSKDIPTGSLPWPLIERREATLYFMGETTYADHFGDRHKTRFCLYLAPPGVWSFAENPEWNDAN
jgi:hypothetical protein